LFIAAGKMLPDLILLMIQILTPCSPFFVAQTLFFVGMNCLAPFWEGNAKASRRET